MGCVFYQTIYLILIYFSGKAGASDGQLTELLDLISVEARTLRADRVQELKEEEEMDSEENMATTLGMYIFFTCRNYLQFFSFS